MKKKKENLCTGSNFILAATPPVNSLTKLALNEDYPYNRDNVTDR